MEEIREGNDREISFSATLRERIGHHVYGEQWAGKIMQKLDELDLLERPIHIISANLHSVLNTIYAPQVLDSKSFEDIEQIASSIAMGEKNNAGKKIYAYALKHGFVDIPDQSGTNIGTQIIDTAKLEKPELLPGLLLPEESHQRPVFVVMDYAFGEQAFECMDELFEAI